jgi:hypothetical protein
VAPSITGSSCEITTSLLFWSVISSSRSRHSFATRSSVVPVPSGLRKIGAVSEPIAERTSSGTVIVSSFEPSLAMKSNDHSWTSLASGVHLNRP